MGAIIIGALIIAAIMVGAWYERKKADQHDPDVIMAPLTKIKDQLQDAWDHHDSTAQAAKDALKAAEEQANKAAEHLNNIGQIIKQ